MENNPIVTITMEDGGKIVAELYPDIAPQSVRNSSPKITLVFA